MLIILAAVFISVFIVVALLMVAAGTGAAQREKQTRTRLDSVLSPVPAREEVADIVREDALSTIPWLDRWLQRIELLPRLRLLLYQADLNWTVGGLLLTCLSCWVVAGSAVYWRTGADIFAILIGAVASGAPFLYVFQKRINRFNSFEERLPEALEMIVSALRAGHSFISAIGVAAKEANEPIKREFRTCYEEQNFGMELRLAMMNLATRVPIDDVAMIVTAVLIQKESGGNLAEILEKVAHIIRERFRLQRQIRVHTAQGRLTGWILAALPMVLGLALYLFNPKHMSLLWERAIGVKLLYTAATMMLIGTLIIRKIIRIRV